MGKRVLTFAMLAFVAVIGTAEAASWFFKTQVMSAGGAISSRNMTNQRVADGPFFRSYTSNSVGSVSVIADPGYTIRSVVVNSVNLGAQGRSYSTTVQGPTDQSVTATFLADPLTVTARNPGGTVAPASLGNMVYGYTLRSPVTFTFTPAVGYQITGIDNVPGDPKVTHSAYSPGVNKSVWVRFDAGYTFTASVNLQAAVVNATPAIVPIPPQTVTAGSAVQLSAAAVDVSNPSYTWTYVSGPANTSRVANVNGKLITTVSPGPLLTLSGASSPLATFAAPGIPGQYKFKVAVSSSGEPDLTSWATVTVYASAYRAGKNQCQFCHDANRIGPPQLFSNWSASGHRANNVTCGNCHLGANTGGHPGRITAGSVNETTFAFNGNAGSGNFCVTCHSPSIITDFAASPHFAPAGSASCGFCHRQNVHNPSAACVGCHYSGNALGLAWPPAGLDFHNDYSGTDLCANCHRLHNPNVVTGMSGPTHYTNITTGSYPATYMTSRAVCTNCHVSNQTNFNVRHQWDRSGHGATTAPAWSEYDFKTMSGCVQCHTTTGFIAYSTGKVTAAWGVATDKTKELLTCVGCHSDVVNGIVRRVAPAKPFAADDYLNRDVGTSNICMACHTGTNNGLSVTSADFAEQPFIAPHHLAAGGILHGKGGYHFPGRSYAFYSSNTHRSIGMENYRGTGGDGPCVTCHMSAPQKHLFQAISSAKNGAITKITATTCANCHGSSLDDTSLINSRKASFSNALDVLNKALAYRGFVYSPENPYFANTNWVTFRDGAGTMGAAFNYALLLNEPGAYAHNSAYAKQLLFDSIDYLYNGTVTGSIETAAAGLVGNGITQDQANSLVAYQNSSICNDCHANTSGSHPAHLGDGCNCIDCHSATALSNSALVPGNSTHLNGTVDIVPGPGVSFTYAGDGNCSNISCHNGGSATWGSSSIHTAKLGTGVITLFQTQTNHDNGQENMTEQCSLCHYASLVQQHTNNCAICHGGSNPPAAAVATVDGSWDKNCQSGSCHPSIHSNATFEAVFSHHEVFVPVYCAACHISGDPYGGASGDNCNQCHSPALTASAVGDHQPPVTTSDALQPYYVGGATIHLFPTDAGSSGLSLTRYSLDGGSRWTLGTQIVISKPLSSYKAYTLLYNSTDHALNVESVHSVSFTVFANTPAAPTTTSSFNPPANSNYTANQPVTLTAIDNGSGVKATYYQVDAGAFTQGTSFTVAGDGLHSFSYYSVDYANNAETTHVSNTFRIDTIAPSTTCSAVSNLSYTGDQTFTLTATDSGSGVASTWYAIDGGAFVSGTSVPVAAPKTGGAWHTISWYSVDNATNKETTKSVSVYMQAAPDTTPPVTVSSFNPAPGANFKTSQAVTLTATDASTGVKATYYKIDAATFFTQGATFTITGDGLHNFSYYSVDNVNNTETTHVSNTFRIDTTPPYTTCSAVSGGSYNGDQTFTLTAADSGSGVAATWYQLDGGAFSSGTTVAVAGPSTGSVSHTISWYSVDNAGNQESTKSATFTVGVLLPPSAPTAITVNSGNGQATVAWSAGTGATSSLVRYGTTSGVYATTIDPATSPQTITGLTNGSTIYYQVGARNAAGTTWSDEYNFTPSTTTQLWSVPGSYTFTVPASVASLTIDALGGGGHGGSGSGGDNTGTFDGANGGNAVVSYQSTTKASAQGGSGGKPSSSDWGAPGGAGGTATGSLSSQIVTNGGNGSPGWDDIDGSGSGYGGAGGAPNGFPGSDGVGVYAGGGGGGGGGGRVQGALPVTPGSVVSITIGTRSSVQMSW